MRIQPIEDSPEDVYLSQGGGAVMLEAQTSREPFDDVFGSAPASPTAEGQVEAQNSSHPSDIHRLQTEHTTAGYREGISVAKESSIQEGFDEGFSLGACIGSRAGQLLGIVEGIADALKKQQGEAAASSEKLLTDAKAELSTAKIFSGEYWAPDGNWSYEVDAADGDQVVFSDVANAHPLIRKWSQIVDEQVNLWQIRLSLLDDETSVRLDTDAAAPSATSAPARSKQSLDW